MIEIKWVTEFHLRSKCCFKILITYGEYVKNIILDV